MRSISFSWLFPLAQAAVLGFLPSCHFDLDLQVVDNLLGGPFAQPWGRIAASFSVAAGGFSVTGTFDSAVCLATGTL